MVGNESAVNEIAQNLAFEVEAIPRDDILRLASSSKTTPLNLKIRVRKKNEATDNQGFLSVPKLGQPGRPPERIRLISSDQTILSFNVFMETDQEKKSLRKSRKHFFGKDIQEPLSCLGTERDDDDESPYMPYSPHINKASKSEERLKQTFIIKNNDNNYNDNSQITRQKEVFFGKCKPGGCLDPPFSEDKYSYKPTQKAHSPPSSLVSKKQRLNQDEKRTSNTSGILKKNKQSKDNLHLAKQEKEAIITSSSSILSLYQTECLKNSLGSKYSNSIITYAPDEVSNADKNNMTNRVSLEQRSRKSFNEFAGAYFIPSKNISSRKGSNIENVTDKVIKQVYKRSSSQIDTGSVTKEANSQIVKLKSPDLNILRTKTSRSSIEIENKEQSDYKKTTQEDVDIESIQKKMYDENKESKPKLSHTNKELLKSIAENYINVKIPSVVNEILPKEKSYKKNGVSETDKMESIQSTKYDLNEVASIKPYKTTEGSDVISSDLIITEDRNKPQLLNINSENSSYVIDNNSLTNITSTPDVIYSNSTEKLAFEKSDIIAAKHTMNKPFLIEDMNMGYADSIENKEKLELKPSTLYEESTSVIKMESRQNNTYLTANEESNIANSDTTAKSDFIRPQHNTDMEKKLSANNFLENHTITRRHIETTGEGHDFTVENEFYDTNLEYDALQPDKNTIIGDSETLIERRKQEENYSRSHDSFIESSTIEMVHGKLQDSQFKYDVSEQPHETTLTDTFESLPVRQHSEKTSSKKTISERRSSETGSDKSHSKNRNELYPNADPDFQKENVSTDKYLMEYKRRNISTENATNKMIINKPYAPSSYSIDNEDISSNKTKNNVILSDSVDDNLIGENYINNHDNDDFIVDRTKINADSNIEMLTSDFPDDEHLNNIEINEYEKGFHGGKNDIISNENNVIMNRTKIDDNDSISHKANSDDYRIHDTVDGTDEKYGKDDERHELQSKKDNVVARSLSLNVSPVPLEESQKPVFPKQTDGLLIFNENKIVVNKTKIDNTDSYSYNAIPISNSDDYQIHGTVIGKHDTLSELQPKNNNVVAESVCESLNASSVPLEESQKPVIPKQIDGLIISNDNKIVVNKTKIDDNDSVSYNAIPISNSDDYQIPGTVIGKEHAPSELQPKNNNVVAGSFRGSLNASPIPLEVSQKPVVPEQSDGLIISDENNIVFKKTKLDDNDSVSYKAIPISNSIDYQIHDTVISEDDKYSKDDAPKKNNVVDKSLYGSLNAFSVPLEESQKPAIPKETDGLGFPFTGVIPLRQDLARLSMKSDKDYNKGNPKLINAGPIDHGSVYLDLAFQSYINDEKYRVLKTFDPVNDIQKGPKDIMLLKTKIKPNSTDIRIPIDSKSYMSISIKMEDSSQFLTLKEVDSPSADFGRRENYNKGQIKHTNTDMDLLQNTLSLIYEQQLLPLQHVIKDLRGQVELLGSQQLWLKDHLPKTKRPKLIRMNNSNKRCGCHRK